MSSIILYGPPGGGKTTFMSTLTGLGYRMKVFDADRKILGMKNLEPLVKDESIEVITPEARLTEATLKLRVLGGLKAAKPKQQPLGYLELIDFITDLEEEPPEDACRVIPVIDSLTRAVEHLTRLILFIQGKNTFTFDEYKFLLNNLEELFDCFFNLQPSIYPHCIITCHDKVEKDTTTGKIKILPLVEGSFREKVGSYVSEMYYCFTEADKQGDVDFVAQTKPVGEIMQARSSYGADTYVPQDFKEIFSEERAPEWPKRKVKP